jgi:hypothetical protein
MNNLVDFFGESNFGFCLNFTGSDNLQHHHQKSAKFSRKVQSFCTAHPPVSPSLEFFILGLFPRGESKNVDFSDLFLWLIFYFHFPNSLSEFLRIKNRISGHSQNRQQKKTSKNSLLEIIREIFFSIFFLADEKKIEAFLNYTVQQIEAN